MGTGYESLRNALLTGALSLLAAVPVAQAEPPASERPPAVDAQASGKGRLVCRIKENGDTASGTAVVRNGEEQVAKGSCGGPLELAAGTYEVVLRLDGALDDPEKRQRVTIKKGHTAQVTADFSTGVLEVHIEADGRRAPGTARILRGGEQVGTLGSGVAAHLSSGTYVVVVRYRTEERRYDDVQLAAGQRRKLQAKF